LASAKKLLEKKMYRRAALELKNALKTAPRDAELYYQLGVTDLGSSDIQEAALSLKRAIELDPKHVAARLKLAQLLASSSDPELLQEANKRLASVLEDNADNIDALDALALTELKLGKLNEGIGRLSAALKKSPENVTSSVLLAEALMAQHDLKGAENALKGACERNPASPGPAVTLARFYMRLNRLAEAEGQLRHALTLAPQDLATQGNLAMLLNQQGRVQEAEPMLRGLSRVQDPNYSALLGMFLFEHGRQGEAVHEFERLNRVDPAERAARTRLVAVYRSLNRGRDAERVLSDALKKNPTDLDALLQRSELYIGAKDFARAEADLNAVLHYRPTSGEAHFILAAVRQAQGAALLQRQELGQAIQLNPYLLAARLQFAQLLIEAKDSKTAVTILDEAPSAQKTMLAFIIQRNWALWSAGSLDEMRKGIDAGLKLQRLPDLLIQDGLWKLSQRDYAGARISLEEALNLNPQDLRALDVLRQSYLAQKQPAQAIQKVKEFAAKAPKSAPVQQFLGSVLAVSGNLPEARAALVAATKEDPKFVPAYLSLVQLDIAEKRWGDAEARLQDLLPISNSDPLPHIWLGNISATKGDNARALKYYQDALAADPNNTQALNNLAYLTSEFGNNPNAALRYAQKARELAPGMPQYADTLGWILYRKGLYDGAVKALQQSGSYEGDIVWKYHLAMAYAKAGNIAEGRAVLNAALKRNPNVPEAEMAKQIISLATTTGRADVSGSKQ